MITKDEMAHEVEDEVQAYTVKEFLKDGDLSFYLPIQWSASSNGGDGIGGEEVKDPLTVYASVDVTGGDERFTFKTTMKDLLEDTYDLHRSYRGPKALDARSQKIFKKIRAGLLKEVKRIDKWLEEENSK
jgi:hypothetical protein